MFSCENVGNNAPENNTYTEKIVGQNKEMVVDNGSYAGEKWRMIALWIGEGVLFLTFC